MAKHSESGGNSDESSEVQPWPEDSVDADVEVIARNDAKQRIMDDELNAARKACKTYGDFKVMVETRPKLAWGGWTVNLRRTSTRAQFWQQRSNNRPKHDTLMDTVLHANELCKRTYDDWLEEEREKSAKPDDSTKSKRKKQMIGKPMKKAKSKPCH